MLDSVGRRVEELRRRGVVRPTDARGQAAAHRLLAEIFVMLEAPVRAAGHLRRLIELEPTDRPARGALALELASLGDLEGALAVIEQARRRFGRGPGLGDLEARVRALHAAAKRR